MMMFILPLQMTSPYSWPFSFLTWIFVSSLSNYCFHACLLSINPMYQNHNASDSSSASYPLLHSSPYLFCPWCSPRHRPETQLTGQCLSEVFLSLSDKLVFNHTDKYRSCVCVVHFHCMFFFDFSSSSFGLYVRL